MKTLLVIIGIPLWLPLLISLFAVILALCVSLWIIVISLWACFISFVLSAPVGIAAGVMSITAGNTAPGAILIACGIMMFGLAIFAFYGCKYATKGSANLTARSFGVIRNMFE